MAGPLKNELHERFALAYAKHRNGTRAAVEAGYAPGPDNAWAGVHATKLLKRPEVAQRISEVKEAVKVKTAELVAVDRAWVLEKLMANAINAIEANDRGAANRALELIGKEQGMFVERRMEMRSPLDGLQPNELAALVRLLDQGLPIDITPNNSDQADAESGVESGVDDFSSI
jgi:hypothetical protein